MYIHNICLRNMHIFFYLLNKSLIINYNLNIIILFVLYKSELLFVINKTEI